MNEEELLEKELLEQAKLAGARVIDYRDFLQATFSSTYQIVFTLPQLKKLLELASSTRKER